MHCKTITEEHKQSISYVQDKQKRRAGVSQPQIARNSEAQTRKGKAKVSNKWHRQHACPA